MNLQVKLWHSCSNLYNTNFYFFFCFIDLALAGYASSVVIGTVDSSSTEFLIAYVTFLRSQLPIKLPPLIVCFILRWEKKACECFQSSKDAENGFQR